MHGLHFLLCFIWLSGCVCWLQKRKPRCHLWSYSVLSLGIRKIFLFIFDLHSCTAVVTVQLRFSAPSEGKQNGHFQNWLFAIFFSEIAKHLSLPPVKLHCSMLAEDAIKAAVKDYEAKKSKTGQKGEDSPSEKAVEAWTLSFCHRDMELIYFNFWIPHHASAKIYATVRKVGDCV